MGHPCQDKTIESGPYSSWRSCGAGEHLSPYHHYHTWTVNAAPIFRMLEGRQDPRRPQPECDLRPDIQSLILLLALLLPAALAGQDPIPRDLAEVEIARSRACVGALADLAELDTTIESYAQRADRLNALGLAVSLEKRQDADPFDAEDPTETAVAQWFAADSALAARFLERSDSTILVERDHARTVILDQLRQKLQEVSEDAQGKIREGAAISAAAEPCVGAILIRSVVLEECDSGPNPVCDAARAEEPQAPYRFVDAPSELWDMEEYGPWTRPEPLQAGPAGDLVGARTSTRARIGNVAILLTLKPLLRKRSDLSEEEAAQYQANLDSLGFTFDHPDFVMIPGIDLQGNLPPPLGGETHYLLHFGDLSGDDLIWSMEAGSGGPLRAVFPARAADLARLQAGEVVSLSAIRAPDEEGAASEAVFTLSLLQVGQESNVRILLQYFADGSLNRDLRALIPPGSGG